MQEVLYNVYGEISNSKKMATGVNTIKTMMTEVKKN